MKTAYAIFIIIVLIFTVMYIKDSERQLINEDLQYNAVVTESHRVVYSRWFSFVPCEGQTLKSFGYPTTGLPCTSTAYCQEHWPHGISYQVRDSVAVCCTDLFSEGYGECGQWHTE